MRGVSWFSCIRKLEVQGGKLIPCDQQTSEAKESGSRCFWRVVLISATLWFFAVGQIWESTTHQSGLIAAMLRPSLDSGSVTVVKWSRPQSGWLYVLDSNFGRASAQILLVDPQQGSVMGVIETGYEPDMALSPDGTRLFVTCGLVGQDSLSIVDTGEGKVIGTASVGWQMKYIRMPLVTSLGLSPSGRWLYIKKMTPLETGIDEYSIAVFDTQTLQFVPDEIATPQCENRHFLIGPTDKDLQTHCGVTNTIRTIQLSPSGSLIGAKEEIELPPLKVRHIRGEPIRPLVPLSHERAIQSFWSAERQSFLAIMGDGGVWKIEPPPSQNKSALLGGRRDRQFPLREWPRSANGRTIFLGSEPIANTPSLDQVHVINTMTMAEIAMVRTSIPFWALALSRNDKYLYATSGLRNQTITVIDAANFRELKAIKGIGTTPSIMIIAP